MHRNAGPATGIMVWGGIGFHCRTPPIRIGGILNSQRYVCEVLEPVVLHTFSACHQPYSNRIMSTTRDIPFPDLLSSDSTVLRGLPVVFPLSPKAPHNGSLKNPVFFSDSLTPLISSLSYHLSPNYPSVIACSSATPVRLGSLDLLFFCRPCRSQST
ncbi:hypothetical protein TNCV_3957681 [Trichonephila clavipes]|nr:hypothetical protein TNCV_3957681 [Trichonephila clavipes]